MGQTEQIYLLNTDTNEIVDNFVNITAGKPYRLLPFGALYKGGKKREITPEYANQFKLAHFKPPIKRGSHDEAAPANGHIIGLEVRDDGLYAIPELNDQGVTDLDNGAYRYHSPEIVWEDSYIENPTTGEKMTGPMIVGDAWLHTPHLGEAAALYTYQPTGTEPPENLAKELNQMSDEMVTVPASFFDKLTSLFAKKAEQPEMPAVEPEQPDELSAAINERDDYKTKYEAMLAEQAKAEQLTAIRKEFDTDEFGTAYIELGKADEAAEMLASMSEPQRAWVLQSFKALSAQIKEGEITGEKGSNAEGAVEGAEGAHAAILKYASEKNVSYNQAIEALRVENPEIIKEAF